MVGQRLRIDCAEFCRTPSRETLETLIFMILRFIEKPSTIRAKKIIKQNGYWNSGIFFLTKESLINNFKKEQPNILKNAFKAVLKSKYKKTLVRHFSLSEREKYDDD